MKVSIITPVFGEINLQTGHSVLEQTCQDFEWIVVYDGGADHIIPDEFTSALYSHKLKLVSTRGNYGPSVARNIGFSVSDGDIIAYVDNGDLLVNTYVDTLIRFYTARTEVELVFTPYCIEQEINHKRELFIYDPSNRFFDGRAVQEALEDGNISIPLGVSHRRKYFMLAGMFQRGIVCGEDGILWRRMASLMTPDQIGLIVGTYAGIYKISPMGQSRTQRRFDMGGFAFDAGNEHGRNGQYLDKDWFMTYNSVKLFDKKEN